MLVGVNAASASSSTATKFVNTQIADGWWLENAPGVFSLK
jgi:hypothetical protein